MGTNALKIFHKGKTRRPLGSLFSVNLALVRLDINTFHIIERLAGWLAGPSVNKFISLVMNTNDVLIKTNMLIKQEGPDLFANT